MIHNLFGRGARAALALGAGAVVSLAGALALAGDPYVRRAPSRVVVLPPTTSAYQATSAAFPTARVLPGTLNEYGRLGSFYPTPYLMVRGNAPAGGGYSPLGSFGDTTLSLYGPLSSLRMTSAPVTTYARGYDGRIYLAPGNSFSAPNLPNLTPVVYPTQSSNYYGFRQSGSPPWWANAINWIDQN